MRKLHMVLSRHSPRDWIISAKLPSTILFYRDLYDTYGAMTTREPGTGKEPIPSISLGTCASHWSSWRVKVLRLSEYQEPAWEGSLDCIMSAFPS
jgi:hypothetical protein